MIKADELRAHPKIPVFNGEDPDGMFTLEYIGNAIKEKMQQYGIDVGISANEVKTGSVFNSTKEDCIEISNNEHYNYARYCIVIRRQGIMAFITTYIHGVSGAEIAVMEDKNAPHGGVAGFLHKKLFGPNLQKIEEEQNYYTMLNSCVKAVLGGE